jgi:sulfide:quinone oxidoreductase
MAAERAFRVVIAGGGIAALEAALELHELAGERVAATLLAPEPEFVYRPMTVGEPFSLAPARRHPVAAIAARGGAELVAERFARVDAPRRTVHTEAGSALEYDALILAIGARLRAPFAHGIVVDDRHMDELLRGIVQDVEGGYVRRVAFVSGARLGWPLPLYELALLAAHRARDFDVELEATVVTPERAPLEVFGEAASAAVDALLREAGVAVVTAAHAQVPQEGRVVIAPGDRTIAADRVIVMPELFGPAVRGLPAAEHGFIPTGPDGSVAGVERVFAAGDATDYPVKQGGIAAQQADAAAATVAALAGAAVAPAPPHREIHGMLLTGRRPLWLAARLAGGRGLDSRVSDEPLWQPAGKVDARRLAPGLDELG